MPSSADRLDDEERLVGQVSAWKLQFRAACLPVYASLVLLVHGQPVARGLSVSPSRPCAPNPTPHSCGTGPDLGVPCLAAGWARLPARCSDGKQTDTCCSSARCRCSLDHPQDSGAWIQPLQVSQRGRVATGAGKGTCFGAPSRYNRAWVGRDFRTGQRARRRGAGAAHGLRQKPVRSMQCVRSCMMYGHILTRPAAQW